MRKYLTKRLAGRLDDFKKINLNRIKETIPKNYLKDYLFDADSLSAFAKDAIKEYLYENDDESDEIAASVFGEDYLEKFDGNVNTFINELAIKIVSNFDEMKNLPSGLQEIIDIYAKALQQIENDEQSSSKEEIVKDEINTFIKGAKKLGFEDFVQQAEIVIFERKYDKIDLYDYETDGLKTFENVTLSIAMNYEDVNDLYFEGGMECENKEYRYKPYSSLDDMLNDFKHPEKIQFKK